MRSWNWEDTVASPGVHSAERLYQEGPRGETEPICFENEAYNVIWKRFKLVCQIRGFFSGRRTCLCTSNSPSVVELEYLHSELERLRSLSICRR
jgi:hypothetical protein